MAVEKKSPVSTDQSEKEINEWLEYKKVTQKKRDLYADNIEILVDAMSEGILTIDPQTKVITHTLKFPIKNEESTLQLQYEPRLKIGKVQAQMASSKTNDAVGMIISYIAALTGKPKNLIKELDGEDYNIASAIVIFFL